jgi:hypothetical protein
MFLLRLPRSKRYGPLPSLAGQIGNFSSKPVSLKLLHRLPEHRLPEHRLPEHRLPEHRLPEHRLPEHRLPEHRLPEHRLPEQRLPEHRLPEHRAICPFDPAVCGFGRPTYFARLLGPVLFWPRTCGARDTCKTRLVRKNPPLMRMDPETSNASEPTSLFSWFALVTKATGSERCDHASGVARDHPFCQHSWPHRP